MFLQTKLRTPESKELIGCLKLVPNNSQGLATADELLINASGVFQFRQTNPLEIISTIGDSLVVVNTVSGLVKIGEVLKVVAIDESVVPIVNKLIGVKLTLVTNTVRYRVSNG